MPTVRSPRRGSLQFWPRKKAERQYARIRSWANVKEAKPLGFAGYKVGMTHALVNDNRKNTLTKGMDVFFPLTVLECPPLKVASVRFYKNTINGRKAVSEVFSDKLDKELGRSIIVPKKTTKKLEDIKDFDHIRLLVYTQPKLTGIKKRPEVFEVAVGGKKDEQVKYASEKLGKEISLQDVFSEGQQIDIHGVTKGKGYQGPVKRFGVSLKNHKTEKGQRRVGTLGAWCGQGHFMWRVAHAGQMGYHTRTEYNKQIIKIGQKPEDIRLKGGFIRYGDINNTYLLIKGSVFGPAKRMLRLNVATRPTNKVPSEAPAISYLSLESKQGN